MLFYSFSPLVLVGRQKGPVYKNLFQRFCLRRSLGHGHSSWLEVFQKSWPVKWNRKDLVTMRISSFCVSSCRQRSIFSRSETKQSAYRRRSIIRIQKYVQMNAGFHASTLSSVGQMPRLQPRFDFESTAVLPPFDRSLKVIKVTVTLFRSQCSSQS